MILNISKYNVPVPHMQFKHNPFENTKICYPPKPPKETFPDFTGIILCDGLKLFRKADRIWALCQVLYSDQIGSLPTWAAYNSLVNESLHVTCQSLPLYLDHPLTGLIYSQP